MRKKKEKWLSVVIIHCYYSLFIMPLFCAKWTVSRQLKADENLLVNLPTSYQDLLIKDDFVAGISKSEKLKCEINSKK